MPLKVHLRLRFQNLGKPRTAGLCGRAAGACDCGPLSCTKIERPSPPEKPSCKVRFFAQNHSRKYRQKVTATTLFQTVSYSDFQLLAQTAHVCFHRRKCDTLGFRRKIAHNGTHGETGASPPSATAQSCATSEITLYAVFVTPDSAALLYTYISRFSVNPQHQQKRIIRQSCHHKFYPQPLFNFSYNRPTFAFTSESGYALAFAQRIAHNGSHGETRGVSDGGAITTLGAFHTFRKPCVAGV